MEIDDEDVVARGTDLQKYLLAVGCSEFEVSDSKNVVKPRSPVNCRKKFERKIDQQNQNDMVNLDLCINLIKIIIESQLMFKEDTLFIKEFIPSNHYYGYPSVFTKQNSIIASMLFICIFLNVFFTKYYYKWITICILIVWFGYVIMKIVYKLNLNRTIKNTVLKTLKCMSKCSLLVQKTTHFIQECNNLHGVYCCSLSYHSSISKSSDSFKYLLMPELKTLFLTVLSELIDSLVYNIFEIHKFFPLKDSVANLVYLYLTDCKIDTQNTSLENINKAKYVYFLLQSEFLKLTALCFCPVLWVPDSCLQMSRLIKTVGEFEKIYLDSYDTLYEEYNLYSLFKNNNIEHSKQVPNNGANAISDLKSKVYSVRHLLQNMMVHVRFMEDSIENSSESTSDLTGTLNVLVKEVSVFSEFISNLQICILKSSNNNQTKHDCVLTNEGCDGENNGYMATEANATTNSLCEDELFVGVSDKLGAESADCKVLDEEIFDKSNNRDLIMELKVALENKQVEWKIREEKLLEKHPHLTDLSECKENNEILLEVENTHKVRKVALDLPLDEGKEIMQLPNTDFASEIAMVACKWNTEILSIGDDSDSDGSANSTDS